MEKKTMKTNNIFDINNVISVAKSLTKPTLARNVSSNQSRVGSPAMSIVNNENGHRVSFNRGLSEALGLEETVDIVSLPGQRQILVGKSLHLDAAITFGLKNSRAGTKIVYSSPLVDLLTNDMQLNYNDGTTSRNLSNVHITEYEGETVAVIQVDDASAGTTGLDAAFASEENYEDESDES